jgi:predicted DNA-binding transcriptional regulator AlpA
MNTSGMATPTHSVTARKAAEKPNTVPSALENFKSLPDEAYVDVKVVCGLLYCAESTYWAWVKQGRLPKPRKFGRSSRQNVGGIRAVLAAGEGA